MHCFLIDKITELEIGQKLKGVKNVTFSDNLARPFGANWTPFPAAFVLEAMTQAAILLVAATVDYQSQPILKGVQRMQIYGRAAAGDQIEIFAGLEALRETEARVYVHACLDGVPIAEATVFLSLVSLAASDKTVAFEHRRNLQAKLTDLFPGWFQAAQKAETVI